MIINSSQRIDTLGRRFFNEFNIQEMKAKCFKLGIPSYTPLIEGLLEQNKHELTSIIESSFDEKTASFEKM